MRGLLTIALWLHASGRSVAAPTQSFVTVKTENGDITGHSAPKAKDVLEYLGIPYAQPPLGELRFAAPQKYIGEEPYTAANFVSPTSIFRLDDSTNRCKQG
jgi:cholinesterase